MAAERTLGVKASWLVVLGVVTILSVKRNILQMQSVEEKYNHRGVHGRQKRDLTDPCLGLFPLEYFPVNGTVGVIIDCKWSLVPTAEDCKLLSTARKKNLPLHTKISPQKTHSLCVSGDTRDCLKELRQISGRLSCSIVSDFNGIPQVFNGTSEDIYCHLNALLTRAWESEDREADGCCLNGPPETYWVQSAIRCTSANHTQHIFVRETGPKGKIKYSDKGRETLSSGRTSDGRTPNINVLILREVSRAHFYTTWTNTISVLRDLDAGHFVGLQTTSLSWRQNQAILFNEAISSHRKPPFPSVHNVTFNTSTESTLLDFAKGRGYQVTRQTNYCPGPKGSSFNESLNGNGTDFAASGQGGFIMTTFNAIECLGTPNSSTSKEKDFGHYMSNEVNYMHGLTELLFQYVESGFKVAGYPQLQISELLLPVNHNPVIMDVLLAGHLKRVHAEHSQVITFLLGDKGSLLSGLAQQSAFWHTDQFNPPFSLVLPQHLHDYHLQEHGPSIRTKLASLQNAVMSLHNVREIIGTFLCMASLMKTPRSMQPSSSDNQKGTLNTCQELVNWLSISGRTGASRDVHTGLVKDQHCNGLPLEPSVTCVCDCKGPPGPSFRDTARTTNDSIQVAMAEFALGQMNNLVQNYTYTHLYEHRGFHRINKVGRSHFTCPRLVGSSFRHVGTSYTGANSLRIELLITTMTTANISDGGHLSELQLQGHQSHINYRVVVERLYNASADRLRLVEYRKVDWHGLKDSVCGLDPRASGLCHCLPSEIADFYTEGSRDFFRPLIHFGVETEVTGVHEDCLFLLIRQYLQHSFVFEAANVCSDRQYRVTLRLVIQHMALSSESPVSDLVPHRGQVFLVSVWQDVYVNVRTNILYNFKFTVL